MAKVSWFIALIDNMLISLSEEVGIKYLELW